MQIVALAGGVGGARFIRGLRTFCDSLTHGRNAGSDRPQTGSAPTDQEATAITVIANTGDDITMFGLRVCPDMDTLMYTLGGGINEANGWGRTDDSGRVQSELAAYGAGPQWFALGDADFATHVARTQWLGQGQSLSQVTARLASRWQLPQQHIQLLPMSDDRVETHVLVDAAALPHVPPLASEPTRSAPPGAPDSVAAGQPTGTQVAVHFQQWWVGMGAGVPAAGFVGVGLEQARPAPGVTQAIESADLVLLPPSNPVVSIGIILGVPGIREALRATNAPIVGVSPIVAGAPVRGHADACLAALGLACTPTAVAGLYRDFLDGWLVHDQDDIGDWGNTEAVDAQLTGQLTGECDQTVPPAAAGERALVVRRAPLLMRDEASATQLAGAAVKLALELRAQRTSP